MSVSTGQVFVAPATPVIRHSALMCGGMCMWHVVVVWVGTGGVMMACHVTTAVCRTSRESCRTRYVASALLYFGITEIRLQEGHISVACGHRLTAIIKLAGCFMLKESHELQGDSLWEYTSRDFEYASQAAHRLVTKQQHAI